MLITRESLGKALLVRSILSNFEGWRGEQEFLVGEGRLHPSLATALTIKHIVVNISYRYKSLLHVRIYSYTVQCAMHVLYIYVIYKYCNNLENSLLYMYICKLRYCKTLENSNKKINVFICISLIYIN